jgi:hypothetical protein
MSKIYVGKILWKYVFAKNRIDAPVMLHKCEVVKISQYKEPWESCTHPGLIYTAQVEVADLTLRDETNEGWLSTHPLEDLELFESREPYGETPVEAAIVFSKYMQESLDNHERYRIKKVEEGIQKALEDSVKHTWLRTVDDEH